MFGVLSRYRVRPVYNAEPKHGHVLLQSAYAWAHRPTLTRGGAHLVGVEGCEDHSTVSESVQIWCDNFWRAPVGGVSTKKVDSPIPKVVGQDVNDVRCWLARCHMGTELQDRNHDNECCHLHAVTVAVFKVQGSHIPPLYN
jgi:hypothetical protein